jgi:hypothetical protein
MTNIIIWQKWVDPFGEEDIDNGIESLLNDNEDIEPSFHEEDEDLDSHEDTLKPEQKIIKTLKKNIRVIATPMGIIPFTENTASGKIFNFWVGHTNFSITQNIASIIEETDGVEALDIFTRYRFRIAVGKAFNDSDVMRNINNQTYQWLEDNAL